MNIQPDPARNAGFVIGFVIGIILRFSIPLSLLCVYFYCRSHSEWTGILAVALWSYGAQGLCMDVHNLLARVESRHAFKCLLLVVRLVPAVIGLGAAALTWYMLRH